MSHQPSATFGSDARSLVSIGGGRGAGQVLLGVQATFPRQTAIVAVTDTGRSTGVARTLGDIPAPGDLRSTIAAMAADPDGLFARLLEFRFRSDIPALNGMAFGNLLIAALAQVTGDFAQAIETSAALTQTTAQVLPVSTANVHLCAELEDGSVVEQELNVRGLNKPPIRRLFLSGAAPILPAVRDAIESADVVVIGPGSFFTSLMATLIFDGMAEALRRTRATVAFVANTTTQPGQTDGLRMIDHVRRLVDLLGPGVLDIVLVNRSLDLDADLVARYAAEGLHLLTPDDAEVAAIAALGVRPLVRDYTEKRSRKRELWNKQDTIRHDPALIGQALMELV